MPAQPGFVTRFYTARGFRVTSPFGPRPDPFKPGETEFHTGIDFGGKPQGTPVETPAQGTVFAARSYTGWGNLVAITDFRGYIHLHAHLDSIKVYPGQKVARGDVIGTLGRTGTATGVHLHYQINRPGTDVRGDGYFGNPDEYIFDEVMDVERAIVLGSDADYFNAAPLRDKLNCPVFSRSALGQLKAVKTVYICGGGVEEVVKAAPNAELVNLSGNNRYETARKIQEFLKM
ncbi:MAG: peptidoglycan DD-metalloendopeptidase family protein [Firmicutes bacterium]|nr:peptidoglycan DD-metalloendopeptidase family protein [Bacillota bacterium]HPZ89839.1 peptidoglycan DD-metalloendopeptidase family protein [Bacillota bacterium]